MTKIPYIVTIVAVVLTAVFALLNKVWTGFAYFVLAILLLLALFWGGWLIFKYLTDFKKEQQERFKIYKADKINRSEITQETFEQNEAVYRKDFNKILRREKLVKWFLIVFCFAVAVAFLLGMIWL